MNQMGWVIFKSKVLLLLPKTTQRDNLQYIFLITKVSKTKFDRSQRWKYTLVVAVVPHSLQFINLGNDAPVEAGTIEYIPIKLSA